MAPKNSEPVSDLTESLLRLGFSQYEAKCYVGLMAAEPQTGYRVSKVTGVPQPKVYETLRKLVGRGIAREIVGEPTLFSAIPPDVLLSRLEATFEEHLEDARASVKALGNAQLPSDLEYVERFAAEELIVEAAVQCLETATRRIYLSASAEELFALQGAVEAATDRGVDVVVLTFGSKSISLRGARIFSHASTEGALFRHHQARHIALVVDSRRTLNAVAADGKHWQGIRTASEPVIAAVKNFIRHDIDLQQIFADFGPQLVQAYGPGLQALESYRQDQSPLAANGTVGGEPIANSRVG